MHTVEILYISTYMDEVTLNSINSKTKEGFSPSVASIKYAKLIRNGLVDNATGSVKNLYLPIIAPFPQSSVKFFLSRKVENGRYIPFFNFTIIKQACISIFVFLYTLIWIIRKPNKKKIVLMSSIQLPFLFGVFILKIFNIKICSFVPDIPQYQFSYSDEKYWLKKILIPLYIQLVNKLIFCINFFVLITKHQKKFFPQKPFIIVEGFVDKEICVDSNLLSQSETFNIMYAGALFEKYGIKMLIDAFMLINNTNCRLWLFGGGDMVEYIKLCAVKDDRIIFYGNCTNEEVMAFERKATLLVNPRFSNNEFTRYSFPSKLMEYMSSGTPVLTTRLSGIPDDYHDKMLYLDDETVLGIKEKILYCISLDPHFLINFGKEAQRYVFEKKNNITQISYILNWITKLYI